MINVAEIVPSELKLITITCIFDVHSCLRRYSGWLRYVIYIRSFVCGSALQHRTCSLFLSPCPHHTTHSLYMHVSGEYFPFTFLRCARMHCRNVKIWRCVCVYIEYMYTCLYVAAKKPEKVINFTPGKV